MGLSSVQLFAPAATIAPPAAAELERSNDCVLWNRQREGTARVDSIAAQFFTNPNPTDSRPGASAGAGNPRDCVSLRPLPRFPIVRGAIADIFLRDRVDQRILRVWIR